MIIETKHFEKLAKRMHGGYFKINKESEYIEEDVPAPCRRKGRRRPILSIKEKLDILH